MTQQHPIAPSPELVQQWTDEIYGGPGAVVGSDDICLAKLAAQYGADQELEACCEWLHWQNLATHPELIPSLRAARRSKPQTLNSIALQMLSTIEEMGVVIPEITDTIRRALESLPE